MQEINNQKFYDMLVLANHNLTENKEYLNSLNVFPVPDGDTGINMSATLSNAVKSINFSEDSSIENIANQVSKGALLGARGNSGVILSQILRGFAKGLSGLDTITVSNMVNALVLASESAYRSVMKPKEGTILTVINATSKSAVSNRLKKNFSDFFDCVVVDAREALKKTQDMLPENKSAGTVDAAGAGLVIILQSFSDVINNKADVSSFRFTEETNKRINFIDVHPAPENILFQYCTEFIIKSAVKEIDLIKRFENLGDSIVVVNMEDITKVHLHTNVPGTAFNIAMEYGDLTKMKIDNMKEQSENNPSNKKTPKKVNQAILTVANGEGIVDAFKDVGVINIIHGGQSMNPSVEEIVEAIEKANAENVIILPNNKNIVLSAEQASSVVDCNVHVVRSKTIPQGLVAATIYMPEASFRDNYKSMEEAIEEVVTCQITKAVKNSTINGLTIKIGDVLGIKEDSIICSSNSYLNVLQELFEECITDEISLATIIYGTEIEDEFILSISNMLKDKYSDLEVALISGKQEIYPFIISFE